MDNPSIILKKLTHQHISLLIDLTSLLGNPKNKIVWGYYTKEPRPSYRTRNTGRTHPVDIAEDLIGYGLAHQRPQDSGDYELIITKEGKVFCQMYAIGLSTTGLMT